MSFAQQPEEKPADQWNTEFRSLEEPGVRPGSFCDIAPVLSGDVEPGDCLAKLFQLLMVAPGTAVESIAAQVMRHANHRNKLQLGSTLLYIASACGRIPGGHDRTRGLNEILAICAPGNKGPAATRGRQRDLLPLPLPAFGAALKLGILCKDPMSGLLLWSSDVKKKVGRQQLRKLCAAATCQVWRLLSVFALNGEATGWSRLAPASVAVPRKSQALHWHIWEGKASGGLVIRWRAGPQVTWVS